MLNQFALALGIISAPPNGSLGGRGPRSPRDKKLNLASLLERNSQLPFEAWLLWSECTPCAHLAPFSETSEFPVDRFSGSLAVSRTMAAGNSGRRPTELSPVGGNWRGADVRKVLGCYLGGDGWGGNTSICEPRCPRLCGRTESTIATVLIRDSAQEETNLPLHSTIGATIMPLAFCNPVLARVRERRRHARCIAIVRYFAFPDSSNECLNTITSPLTGSSPPNASSISTPRTSGESASRTISVSKISKAVSSFTTPPLRCWCRQKSSIAIRGTWCSVRVETDVSLSLNMS